MDNYIVLDIENPNDDRNSISAIGIIVVENNKEKERIYSLINPEDYFDSHIIGITGITPEMVKNQPTLPEYWPKIEDIITKNVVVGHNITYDLSVISKSLERYKMMIPSFNYCCTLKLSRKRMKLDSYGLTDIAEYLNIKYKAHNAIEDARATFLLYQHLNELKEIKLTDIKRFAYTPAYEKDFSDEIAVNINELYGIVKVINNKNEINSENLKVLRSWYDNNKKYSNHIIFNDLLMKIDTLIKKDNIEKVDINLFSKSVIPQRKLESYSDEEINNQILNGIIKCLEYEEDISTGEMDYLEKWINYSALPSNIDKDAIIEKVRKKYLIG
ncbi:MAG: hypothetical protein IJJ47_08425 [Methanosphaera sp.]|nr:hypothetical protein [Methanosphaera sp.]